MALGERGRNPLTPRSTAEGACGLRAAGALERDPAVRCPDDMAAGFLGGLNTTTLARHRATRGLVVWAANRRIPGAYTYEIARAKFIDEIVLASAEDGLDELVLLGAGLDSRPYRLAKQLRRARVIEVDHPASQTSKRARVRRLLGHEPEHVTYAGGRLHERRSRRDARRRRASALLQDAVHLVGREPLLAGDRGRGDPLLGRRA